MVLSRRKLAKNFSDDVEHLDLLIVGEPLCHVFDAGTQDSGVDGPQVENHDHLALGDVVGLELLHQTRDGGRLIRDGILAEGAGKAL